MAGLRNDRLFRGYIETPKETDKNSSKYDKDDEKAQAANAEFDSQEMEAMLEMATNISSQNLQERKVTLHSSEPGSKAKCRVEGSFMYTDPWWEFIVTLQAPNKGRGYKKLEREPQYRIRSDAALDLKKNSVIVKFLNKCKVEKKCIPKFMAYFRGEAEEKEVNKDFRLLQDIIDNCRDIEDEEAMTLVLRVKIMLLKSVHYHVVVNAMDCPKVLEILPLVLHKNLPSLLEKADHGKILKLEEVVKTEPHLLGFRRAIQSKTGLCLPEVEYFTFETEGLLKGMSRLHCDALYVYCALKQKKSRGHTYTWYIAGKIGLKHYVEGSFGQPNKYIYNKSRYKVANWDGVLRYLKDDVEVICIDVGRSKFGRRKRIFIWRYYWAEKNIAESIKVLMETDQIFGTCRGCKYCKCGLCKKCLIVDDSDDDDDVGDDGRSDLGHENDEDVQSSQEQNKICAKSGKDLSVPMEWSDEDFEVVPKLPGSKKCTKKEKQLNVNRGIKLDTKKDKEFNEKKGKDVDSKGVEAACGNKDGRGEGNGIGDGMGINDNKGEHNISAHNAIPFNCTQELQKKQAVKDEIDFGNDKDQQIAARNIRNNPFTLIIGRGGCGKTTVVCKVLEQFCGASIVLAAPTGKAASNLRKRVKDCKNIVAKTLHQIIYTKALSDSNDTEWEFKDTEILVVDECSMVGCVLLSQVLQALQESANLKKVILMGDYRQLPAIDAGNLLEDLYKKFRNWNNVCVELMTNHRTESQHIVDCAIKISSQQMPDLDTPEVRLVDPSRAGKTYEQLINDLHNTEPGIKDDKNSQFIAFRRKDVHFINRTCCPLYAKHPMWEKKGKLRFQKGDKICPSRNSNVTHLTAKKDYEEKLMKEKEKERQEEKERKKCRKKGKKEGEKIGDGNKKNSEGDMENGESDKKSGDDGKSDDKKKQLPSYMRRICNGEIFFIEKIEVKWEQDEKIEEVFLKDDGENLKVPMSELRNLSEICHAWARTIHTYQGSESDVVVYWLGFPEYQNWQHVYTAVTRGRKKVIIIGTRDNLRQAIHTPPTVRHTVLEERLGEKVKNPAADRMRQVGNASVRIHNGYNEDGSNVVLNEQHTATSIHGQNGRIPSASCRNPSLPTSTTSGRSPSLLQLTTSGRSLSLLPTTNGRSPSLLQPTTSGRSLSVLPSTPTSGRSPSLLQPTTSGRSLSVLPSTPTSGRSPSLLQPTTNGRSRSVLPSTPTSGRSPSLLQSTTKGSSLSQFQTTSSRSLSLMQGSKIQNKNCLPKPSFVKIPMLKVTSQNFPNVKDIQTTSSSTRTFAFNHITGQKRSYEMPSTLRPSFTNKAISGLSTDDEAIPPKQMKGHVKCPETNFTFNRNRGRKRSYEMPSTSGLTITNKAISINASDNEVSPPKQMKGCVKCPETGEHFIKGGPSKNLDLASTGPIAFKISDDEDCQSAKEVNETEAEAGKDANSDHGFVKDFTLPQGVEMSETVDTQEWDLMDRWEEDANRIVEQGETLDKEMGESENILPLKSKHLLHLDQGSAEQGEKLNKNMKKSENIPSHKSENILHQGSLSGTSDNHGVHKSAEETEAEAGKDANSDHRLVNDFPPSEIITTQDWDTMDGWVADSNIFAKQGEKSDKEIVKSENMSIQKSDTVLHLDQSSIEQREKSDKEIVKSENMSPHKLENMHLEENVLHSDKGSTRNLVLVKSGDIDGITKDRKPRITEGKCHPINDIKGNSDVDQGNSALFPVKSGDRDSILDDQKPQINDDGKFQPNKRKNKLSRKKTLERKANRKLHEVTQTRNQVLTETGNNICTNFEKTNGSKMMVQSLNGSEENSRSYEIGSIPLFKKENTTAV